MTVITTGEQPSPMMVDLSGFTAPHPFRQADVLYTVVSRVNLRLTGVGQADLLRDRLGRAAIDQGRVDLVRRYSLPSMRAQIAKPHRWFLMFDPEVTAPVAALLEELAAVEWIVPVFGDSTRACLAQIHDHIRHYFGNAGFRTVGLTRLDSDDAIHRAFHAAVDRVIGHQHLTPTPIHTPAVNLCDGAYLVAPNLFTARLRDSFFTLLEPFGQLTDSIIRDHSKLRQRAHIVQVATNQPAFLYVRHNLNISGQISSTRLVLRVPHPQQVLPEFGLSPEVLLP